MNSFKGHISGITTHGNLSQVIVSTGASFTIHCLVIDSAQTADYLEINRPITVLFKETEVIISTNKTSSISIQNQWAGSIQTVTKGKILSRVEVKTDIGKIVGVISTNAFDKLHLVPNMSVSLMVQPNAILLSKE